MKQILFVILIMGFCLTVSADTYCLFDPETGEGKGTASIKEDYVADWAKDYILKKAPDNSYKGKKGYEIKLEGGELRLATPGEIDSYLAQKEQERQDAEKAKKKQELLDLLDEIEVIDKIKTIKP